VQGVRVHVTGSAALDCEGDLLRSAHKFVRSFVQEAIARGAGLVLGAGSEPYGDSGEPCIFDWTALEEIAAASDPAPGWPALRPERFVVAASQRALTQVPQRRTDIWAKCCKRTDFDLSVSPAGWRMGGIIRERQVLRGDVLLVVGGGAGAEHLAELYRDEAKPVIPIHVDLGAIGHDGSGGSRYLHDQALASPGTFFRLREGSGSAAARLSALRLTPGTEGEALAKEVANLLANLLPSRAFYVRLLATEHAEFPAVERFFRAVVDDVVKGRGFAPYEMGRGSPEAAFMNVEVFKGLHRAALVVVDLTGVRPNCTVELGYALGRRRRVVISARAGTELPFDYDKLPIYIWDDNGSPNEQISAYRNWLDRNIDLPPLVE